SNSKGDLYVKVNVEIPTKLSGKQKEILHQFAEVSGDDVFVQRKNFFNQVKDLFQ
ncbi:MAG: molecular chaperone DnaJ, partial [Ruminiclostridium sp.]|nr:molecular chaperone DnaJ [Ruminiclostridium sp.]